MKCEFCREKLSKEWVQIGANHFCSVECHRAMRHQQDQDAREESSVARNTDRQCYNMGVEHAGCLSSVQALDARGVP